MYFSSNVFIMLLEVYDCNHTLPGAIKMLNLHCKKILTGNICKFKCAPNIRTSWLLACKYFVVRRHPTSDLRRHLGRLFDRGPSMVYLSMEDKLLAI